MDETRFLQEVDAFIEQNKEAFLADLGALVAVNSVQGEPQPGAPFGPGPKQALDTALAIAGRMGFATHNCEGYIGYADLPGKSARQIATITHLDVVPEGNGWTGKPFEMARREGYLLGRGVCDDKGPAVVTLYTAKFFKERGGTLPYTLRILLGANEETGMGDVDYYLAHNPQPAFCVTPDAEFPVCYGEKGGYGGWLVSAPLAGDLLDFSGGVARNVVPDRASALVKADIAALHDTENVKVTAEGEGVVRVSGFGKGGHAAMPAGTVNAIALVVDYLLENSLCTGAERAALKMLQTLHASTDGSSVGIAARDEVFDPLTCVGGVIKMEDGCLRQSIDIRFPTSIDADTMRAALSNLAEAAGGHFEPVRANKPFYIDPNTPVIQTLVRTYNEVMGTDAKPFTMGGGTYARHFDNAVSFGIEQPGEVTPDWVGTMHGPDEGVREGLLWDSLKIYILAIARLMELEF